MNNNNNVSVQQMMQNEGAMSRFQQLPSDQGSRHPEVSQVEFRSFSLQFRRSSPKYWIQLTKNETEII
jgi:hypothetical protein